MTPKMMECLDGIAGYLTMPHTDMRRTGQRAAECLLSILGKGEKPRKLHRRLPFLAPVENSDSDKEPMLSILARLEELLASPGVSSAALFLAQPWLDTPEHGCHMCIFYDDDARREEFVAALDEILDMLWAARKQLLPDYPDVDTALKLCKDRETPICLVDLGDAVPAGGAGDSTVVLRAMLRAMPDVPAVVVLKDPDTVRAAVQVGEGGWGSFNIGASDEEGYNQRVKVEAQVIRINPEPYRSLGPVAEGLMINFGVRALLKAESIYIIACEYADRSYDRNMLISMGLEPEKMGIIMQKASHSFKSTYKDVMRSYVYAQTPGFSDGIHTRMPFKRITRPMYPFDEME